MIHHAFAVDAGPTRWGCSTVTLDTAAGRLTLVEGIHRVIDPMADDDIAWLAARCAEARAAGGVVAQEIVLGYAFEASRVQALVETGRSEGVLLGIARMHGLLPVMVSAGQARLERVLDSRASDARVAVVVEYLFGKSLHDRIPATQRPHVYDAALLAAHVLAKRSGLKIKLPAAIIQRLMQLKAEEGARNAGLKAQRAMAEPVRAFLVQSRVVPGLSTLLAGVKIDHDTAVAALRIVARSHKPEGLAARAILQVNGVETTDPAKRRFKTREQRKRLGKRHT